MIQTSSFSKIRRCPESRSDEAWAFAVGTASPCRPEAITRAQTLGHSHPKNFGCVLVSRVFEQTARITVPPRKRRIRAAGSAFDFFAEVERRRLQSLWNGL